jgi:hypothetical protein
MPNKLNDYYFGHHDAMWVKFDKSYIDPIYKWIYYKFKCWIKPMVRQSKKRLFHVNLSDEYYITQFKITSTKSGKLQTITLNNNENHPHKHPNSNKLCLGRFKGEPINKHLMMKVIFCLLITYNEDDCYCVPDYCHMKKITEDNLCQTS